MPTKRVLTEDERSTVAERLKERIYVTFTSLTVVLALSSHAHGVTAGTAATTLLIAVGGTLLAVFVADLVSHTIAHAALPSGSQMRHMVGVVASATGVVIVPLLLLGLAALDVMHIGVALSVSSIVLVATLGIVGFLAVRRVRLSLWLKIALLAGEVVLGLAVVGLELLAHG